MSDRQDERLCLTCGCRVRPSGHPGNMCREIAALRAERDRYRQAAEAQQAARDQYRTERDDLRERLAAFEAWRRAYRDPSLTASEVGAFARAAITTTRSTP